MNIQILLVTVLLWVASVAGSYWYGTGVGKDGEVAKQTEIKQAIEDTRENARQGAASEIAKLKTSNVKAQATFREVVRSAPVGVDCELPADGLRIINEALTGQPGGTGRNGSSGMSGTGSAGQY